MKINYCLILVSFTIYLFFKKTFDSLSGLALTSVSSKTHAVVIDQIRANAKVYSYSIPDKQMTNFPYEPLAVHGHQDSKVRFFAAHKNSMLTSDLGKLGLNIYSSIDAN